MPNIFEYTDYRSYLRDFYRNKKKKSPFFSYRYIGRKVGMDSSFLIKVLQGNLHISNNKIESFTNTFQLDKKESVFFETLVLFNKSKTNKETKLHFEKLMSLKDVDSNKLDTAQYEFFKKWYYSAIWGLLDYFPFKDNYNELAQKLSPSISVKQAKESIDLLKSLNLISEGNNGFYHVNDLNITTGNKWYSQAILDYQKQMIELAGEAVERFDKDNRNISTLTMNIPKEALKEISEVTQKFRRTLTRLVNSYPNSDSVYQMNIQFFPLVNEDTKK